MRWRENLRLKITSQVKRIQKFVDRIWYPPFIGLLAGADNFLLVVPTDGILISSTMLTPKRWVTLAVNVAIGSSLGALILAGLVETHGLAWILHYYPGLDQTDSWLWADRFFNDYGLILVFLVAATPLMQQPTVILAALAETPLAQLGAAVFIGRLLKFLFMAYLGSHAPRVLARLWGLKGELDDAGVVLK